MSSSPHQVVESVVIGRRPLSANLVTITLGVPSTWTSTSIPDEYVRVLIAPDGAELALPEINERYEWILPEGTTPPLARVYTISDHRVIDGRVRLDIDVFIHDDGPGAIWARTCEPGDRVGLVAPHGLYAAADDVAWQLLVCDVTGLPALARILRGLQPGQRAEVHVVLTDPGDRIALPSAADVDVHWHSVDDVSGIADALTHLVTEHPLEAEGSRYVWFAGEARASRAVRKHLRRALGWPQSDFYTCGYWQFDAEKWAARYAEVAEDLTAQARALQDELGDDQGAYLDALDDIYESAGL